MSSTCDTMADNYREGEVQLEGVEAPELVLAWRRAHAAQPALDERAGLREVLLEDLLPAAALTLEG